MPRPHFPNLHKETTRHGSTVYYVRSCKGPRIRIRGEYGSQEFIASYRAVAGLEPQEKVRRARIGTPRDASGFIYFIGAGRHVKIGFSKNVRVRLGELQTGHHEKLKVLHKEREAISDEAKFHARFSDFHSRGEWFSLRGALAKYVGAAEPEPERKVIL